MGDMELFFGRREIPLEAAVEFLETTRSRLCLKELYFYNVVHRQEHRANILDRFASSFANGRDVQLPLKLEKFSFASLDRSLFIRLDTMDTSRLTELCLGKAAVEPGQLTNLIERASSLQHIDLSFLPCNGDCDGPRLQANKLLLAALSFHQNLSAVKVDCSFFNNDTKCMNFQSEFIEMLETIGRRGKLRKLALNPFFALMRTIDMDAICMAICKHIPYLQSIKLYIDKMSSDSVFGIVSMMELEEINFLNWHTRVTANSMRKIAQLPHFKRLALYDFDDKDQNALRSLSNSTTLRDLRIAHGRVISADMFERWSEGFASNLQILMLSEIAEEIDNAEQGLVRLLEKAIRLRILILAGNITDLSLIAIAKSCPNLEILVVMTDWNKIDIRYLQEIVDRCPKLKKFGEFGDEIRERLQIPKYRKIDNVNIGFWNSDFDDTKCD